MAIQALPLILGAAGALTSLMGAGRTTQSRNLEEFLKARMAGKTQSPAQAMLAAQNQALGRQLNAAAAGQPGVNPALALRNASNAHAQAAPGFAAQAANLRSQEEGRDLGLMKGIADDESRRKATLFGAIGQGLSAAGATMTAGTPEAAEAVGGAASALTGSGSAAGRPVTGSSILNPIAGPRTPAQPSVGSVLSQPYQGATPTNPDLPIYGVADWQRPSVFPSILDFRSDERQKENIRRDPKEVDRFIKSLRPSTFQMSQGGERRMGVIAQDMERSEAGRDMVRSEPGGKVVDGSKAVQMLMAAVGRLGERVEQRNASGGGIGGANVGSQLSLTGQGQADIIPKHPKLADPDKYDGGASMMRAIAREAVRAQGGGDYETGRGRVLDRFALSDNPTSRARLGELEESPEIPYRAIWGDPSGHATPFPFAAAPERRDEAIPPRTSPQMNDPRWPSPSLGLYEMTPQERQFVLQNADKATGMTYSGLLRLGYNRAAEDLRAATRVQTPPAQGIERNPGFNPQPAPGSGAPQRAEADRLNATQNVVQQFTLTPMDQFTMEERWAVREMLTNAGVSPEDAHRFLADPTFMEQALQLLGGQSNGTPERR